MLKTICLLFFRLFLGLSNQKKKKIELNGSKFDEMLTKNHNAN